MFLNFGSCVITSVAMTNRRLLRRFVGFGFAVFISGLTPDSSRCLADCKLCASTQVKTAEPGTDDDADLDECGEDNDDLGSGGSRSQALSANKFRSPHRGPFAIRI